MFQIRLPFFFSRATHLRRQCGTYIQTPDVEKPQTLLLEPGSSRGSSTITYCICLDQLRQEIKVPNPVINGRVSTTSLGLDLGSLILCFKYSSLPQLNLTQTSQNKMWFWYITGSTHQKMILLRSFSKEVSLLMEANILRRNHKN